MFERRRLGLRARATVAWAAIALVLSAGLSLLAYELTRSELLADRQDRATAQAYLNARLLRSALRVSDPDVNAVLSSLEGNSRDAALVRADGEWFAGSVGRSPDALPDSLVSAVEEGSAGRQVTSIDGRPHVAVGVPIAEAGARYFELVSLEDIDGALDGLAQGLTVAAVAATGIAALAGWYASGRVLSPLRRMTDAATGIADGDLGTRLDALGDRDLQPLEMSFNRMANTVEDRIDRERRFSSDVSHELRTPLASMLSSIEIARRSTSDPDAIDDALDHLQERAERFHELVLDLLEISRLDAGVSDLQREPVDLRALVEAVVATTVQRDVPVEVGPTVPAVVELDKRRIGQAVMNLVDNAERYGRGVTRIGLAHHHGSVHLYVDDDGPGVPEHERRHVFGRFARGDDARRGSTGTGLGLALVEEHLQLHGGSAHVESSPTGGARFVLALPAGDEGTG